MIKRRLFAAFTALGILTAPVCGIAAETIQTAITAHAAEKSGKCGDNLTWTLDNNTMIVTISGTGAMYDYTDKEKNPFKEIVWLKSIIIQPGVTSIGNYAFYECYTTRSAKTTMWLWRLLRSLQSTTCCALQ